MIFSLYTLMIIPGLKQSNVFSNFELVHSIKLVLKLSNNWSAVLAQLPSGSSIAVCCSLFFLWPLYWLCVEMLWFDGMMWPTAASADGWLTAASVSSLSWQKAATTTWFRVAGCHLSCKVFCGLVCLCCATFPHFCWRCSLAGVCFKWHSWLQLLSPVWWNVSFGFYTKFGSTRTGKNVWSPYMMGMSQENVHPLFFSSHPSMLHTSPNITAVPQCLPGMRRHLACLNRPLHQHSG